MDSTRYQQVKAIFHDLLDLPADARADALAERCGDDADLRTQVEGLLASHDRAGEFLAQPALKVGAGDLADSDIGMTRASQPRAKPTPSTPVGPGNRGDTLVESEREIGPYRIMETLGEGGMGSVYRAEQTAPVRRTVALKVIKLGMDTREVIARFEAERQALALMDHPCIAKVLDAGTTPRGRPYFVMEYVPGVPITEHADRHTLNTVQRLRLFIDVCEAVHHAHQRAIIHRDLKPTNILVMFQNDRATPKIIDFGIAKATNQRLTEQSIFTEHGRIIGTPEYMSPEQAEMTEQGIDIRTDVYSLGVILYELLVGVLPFSSQQLREQGYGGMQRTIREVDPPLPSTRITTLGAATAKISQTRSTDTKLLARVLRGDLDWIVMKAIAKSRTERYESAWSLAEDVRRYLEDEPVLATRPSVSYRLRKFVRRNRAVVYTIAAVVVAMAVGLVFALIAYSELRAKEVELRQALGTAEQERTRAQENEQRSRENEALARKSEGLAKASEARALASEEQAKQALARALSSEKRADAEGEARRRQIEENDALLAHSLFVELQTTSETLWPAEPRLVPDIERWLARVETILAQRPLITMVRDRFRVLARPQTEAEAKADRETHPRLAELDALVARLAGTVPDAERATLEAQRNELQALVATRRTFAFDDPDVQIKHAVLTRLLADLDQADDPLALVAKMRWRLAEARALGQRSLDEHAEAWRTAIAAAASAPAYRDRDDKALVLAPQMGLVPLGADPKSGLLEFAHLQTGAPATRGADGRLQMTPETGLVLVLLPGGTLAMGAAPDSELNQDPLAAPNEQPVHGLRLDPFFLSKFEMTQGQWQRWTGTNPSYYVAGGPAAGAQEFTLTNPIETITWQECHDALRQLGLDLPTEAQWEWAARGGTHTRWFTGDTVESLQGYINFAAKDALAAWGRDETFADGFLVHAAVDALAPSPYGLHHILGNVSEWCRDHYGPYTVPVRQGDGLRATPEHLQKPHRGGSYRDGPDRCRATARSPDPGDARSERRGVRPARRLENP